MDKSSIFKKLYINKASKHLVVNAPQEYLQILDSIPFHTENTVSNAIEFDFVQIFASNEDELIKQLKFSVQFAKFDTYFWICYPKSIGKIKYSINRNSIMNTVNIVGLELVSNVAINETWSALRARPIEMVGKKQND